MRQSDLALDKYRATQSGYFRLATAFALGMGITDGNILYYHGVAKGNMDRKFQHWSTTTGGCMTAARIPLQLIVVAQLCIYLPSPSMIDHPKIRDTNNPHICSHMTSLLTLKNLLVP